MNVQDVIEKALAGNDGIPVTPVEHSSCEDVQIEKLASALNFIAVNLESSYEDFEKVAARGKYKRKRGRAAQRLRVEERFPPHLLPQGPYGPAPLVSPEPEALATKTAPKVEYAPDNIIEHDTPKPRPKVSVSNNSAGGLGSLSTPIESAPKKYAPSIDAPKKSFMDLHGKKLKIGAGIAGLAGLTALGVKKYRDSKDAETKTASASVLDLSDLGLLGSTVAGGVGAHVARKRMRDAGMSDEEINDLVTRTSGTGRGILTGALSVGLGDALGGTKGGALGGGIGGLLAYKSQVNRANRAIKRHQARQKTASVDDVLYHAAQVGKQALLEKVAEDRINPAKISAGAADPYSGEIMPKGENVFGGQTMPAQLVAMKAQKVRARINSDMKKFVNNVGDGYNLQGHLNKMNK